MNDQHLQELVALTRHREALNIELKQVDDRLTQLEEVLLPQFLTANCKSAKVDGRTISIRTDIWPGPADGATREQVAQALKDSDLRHFVAENYNSNTVRSYVLEIAEQIKADCQSSGRLFDEEAVRAGLPEPLRRAMKVSFTHSIRVTKSPPRN